MRPLHELRRVIRPVLRLKTPPREEDADRIAPRYQEWISLYDTIGDEKRDSLRQAIKRMENEAPLPSISVVMLVYTPPIHILREALDIYQETLNCLILTKSMFMQPERITTTSAWTGHIPFVFWLVEELRPGLVVELGTQTGVSYFAIYYVIRKFLGKNRK
jgi:hypothetical protein